MYIKQKDNKNNTALLKSRNAPVWTTTNKEIRRIVVPRQATNMTLKKVEGQGQFMVPLERTCH